MAQRGRFQGPADRLRLNRLLVENRRLVHAGLIIGDAVVDPHSLTFESEIFSVYKASAPVTAAPAREIMGGPLHSLRWLVNALTRRGSRLKKGSLIIPGSPVELVRVDRDVELGVEIEKVAEESPEKIITVTIDPAIGCQAFHSRKLAFGLELRGKAFKAALKLFPALYDAMLGSDASMLEINPLVVNNDGDLLTLDAKMNFDDNALYRHPDIAALRDESEEDPAERRAAEHDLNYIKLEGNIA